MVSAQVTMLVVISQRGKTNVILAITNPTVMAPRVIMVANVRTAVLAIAKPQTILAIMDRNVVDQRTASQTIRNLKHSNQIHKAPHLRGFSFNQPKKSAYTIGR